MPTNANTENCNKLFNNNFFRDGSTKTDRCLLLLENGCDFNKNFGERTTSENTKRPYTLPLLKNVQVVDKDKEQRQGQATTSRSTETEQRRPLKGRNSFHQDVNEALNSLLWQPYEYQAKQAANSGSSSPSSFSSCCSLSSTDLENDTNNRPTQQHRRCGNSGDLHLSGEMVNNLTVYRNRLSQCQRRTASRERLRASATSRLRAVVSLQECCGNGGVTRGRYGDRRCDACAADKDEMRVEVPSESSRAGDNNVLVQSQTVTAPVPAMVSANVIGLPTNHPRQTSVPSRNINAFAAFNHPRNLSEPSVTNNVSILNHQRHSSFAASGVENSNLLATGIRSSSVPKSLVAQKLGESSVTTLNVNSSVDNSTSCNSVPVNINNVDVNFYRAVPCNVVSNLPTIRCVNSTPTDVDNNISNVNIVQAMQPSSCIQLNGSSTSGSTFISANSPKHITTVAQINSAPMAVATNRMQVPFFQPAGTTVTTQVTVHNESISTQNLLHPSTSSQNFLHQNLLQPTTSSSSQNLLSPTTTTSQNLLSPPAPSSQTFQPFHSQNALLSTGQDVQRMQNETRTQRTFTSTEAQTDDTSVGAALMPARDRAASREQRRRERRERRHQRRLNNHQSSNGNQYSSVQNNDRLPDILNSHMPPPYSPAMGNMPTNPVVPTIVPPNVLTGNVVPVPSVVGGHAVSFPPPVVAGQVPLVQGGGPVPVAVPAASGFRFPFPTTGFRRSRYSEEPPKGCCSFLTWRPGSLRWFIALIALVAVCCVLVGTALGAMRPAGRDHLTVSLLMIGVGIVLVTVSGVAWRLTSHDSSTCRAMLGLGSTESVDTCPRRFVPRLPPSYGRPHHPYAAMMYPEFQYRPPPPSYQASMQEYRLRLLLLDRGNAAPAATQNGASPPPTYRSHAGSLLRAPLSSRRDTAQSEYSFPPSYRSQTSSSRPATLEHLNNTLHSREQSLSLSESNHGETMVNNVNILGNTEEDIALDNITIDSLKMVPENEINPVKMLLKGSSTDLESSKDGNLVTIVQTGDQNPVIVTVSGCSQSENNTSNIQITEIPSEMEILAHL